MYIGFSKLANNLIIMTVFNTDLLYYVLLATTQLAIKLVICTDSFVWIYIPEKPYTEGIK